MTGVSARVLVSDDLIVTCHPLHGFHVESIVLRSTGTNLLWNPARRRFDPLGVVLGPPGVQSIDSFDRDIFGGGWFPMFPTAGLPSVAPDEPRWMHGEAPRLPWTESYRDASSSTCEVFTPASGFRVSRTVAVAAGTVTVMTSATNLSGQPQSVSFGEHPCFPRALFAGGVIEFADGTMAETTTHAQPEAARFAAPQETPWPRVLRRDGLVEDAATVPEQADGRHDHVGLRLTGGRAIIRNATESLTVTLDWRQEAMPFALLWEHFCPPGSPWDGDVFAVEMSSTRGRTQDDAVAQENTHVVLPGSMISTSARLTVFGAP